MRAIVRENVRANGNVVIPAGSEIRGHVLNAQRSGRVKGRAQLALRFNEVNINGRWHRIGTQRISLVADDSYKRDAALVGGGAGAGAIIGAIADGKEGAAKGALIGAGTGTGAVLVTRGKEVGIGSRARWRVRLTQPLVIDYPQGDGRRRGSPSVPRSSRGDQPGAVVRGQRLPGRRQLLRADRGEPGLALRRARRRRVARRAASKAS